MNSDPEPLFRPPKGALPSEEPRAIEWRKPVEATPASLQRRFLKFALISFLIIGLLAGAALSAKPIYRKVKLWRSESTAKESLALSKAGKIADARIKAEVAFRLAPGTPLATRAYAVALGREGNVLGARQLFELLVQSGAATEEDQCGLVDMMLRMGDTQAAEQKLMSLGVPLTPADVGTNETSEKRDRSTQAPPSANLLVLASRLCLAQKNGEKAPFFAHEAARLAPADPEAQIILGALELRSVDTHVQGAERLKKIAVPEAGQISADSHDSLKALTILSEAPYAHFAEMSWVAKHLKTHPLAKERHQLIALQLECQAYPERADALLAATQKRYGEWVTSNRSSIVTPQAPPTASPASSGSPAVSVTPEDVSAFCGVLMTFGKAERIPELLPQDLAFRRLDWCTLYLDALGAQGRWKEIIQLLETQKETLPLHGTIVAMYIGRCWSELGERTKAEASWQTALASAKHSPEQLAYYANYIEKLGYKEQSEKARELIRSAR